MKFSLFLSQYLTNLMHKICFTIGFILCLYMFQAQEDIDLMGFILAYLFIYLSTY